MASPSSPSPPAVNGLLPGYLMCRSALVLWAMALPGWSASLTETTQATGLPPTFVAAQA